MTLPTTAEEIYDLLVEDATVAEMLGTYLLPGAEEPIPAIAVLLPLEDKAAETVITGVEVVIARVPTGDTAPFMTGGETTSGQFRLYVTQWTPPDDGDYLVDAMCRRIGQLLPGASWRDNTLPDGLGGLAQMAVVWTNEELAVRWEDDPEPEEEEGEP